MPIWAICPVLEQNWAQHGLHGVLCGAACLAPGALAVAHSTVRDPTRQGRAGEF